MLKINDHLFYINVQNFIHDFGNLKEYDKEQIVTWEDFLIYAIFLEENNKISEDIAKLFENKNTNKDFTSISNFLQKWFHKN